MSRRRDWRRCLRAGLVVAALGGCASIPQGSLYDQLGAKDGIAALATAMLVEFKGDPRIAELFAETDGEYFRERLIEQLCVVADGPCEYTGLPMPDAHSGMDISEREFNYFVEDVEKAMRKVELDLAVQNRLLARLARMRGDIIRQ